MSRFEKKCFIGSATFHGLLLVVFLFGSAFFNSPPKDMSPVANFINVGMPASGPGNPQPAPPPAAAQQEQKPEPPKEIEPPPQREEIRPEPVKPKDVSHDLPKNTAKDKTPLPVKPKDLAKDTKPKSQISTTVIKRPTSNMVDKAAMQLAQAQREKDTRAAREAQARRAEAISELTGLIHDAGTGLSRSPVTSSSIGNDSSGGIATGRYGDGLKALYDSKWILNTDMYNDETAATVKVTVRRDGNILSATIVKPSGNAAFDRSVRSALNAVSRALPFPADMKDSEQEFTWRFERRTRVG